MPVVLCPFAGPKPHSTLRWYVEYGMRNNGARQNRKTPRRRRLRLTSADPAAYKMPKSLLRRWPRPDAAGRQVGVKPGCGVLAIPLDSQVCQFNMPPLPPTLR